MVLLKKKQEVLTESQSDKGGSNEKNEGGSNEKKDG